MSNECVKKTRDPLHQSDVTPLNTGGRCRAAPPPPGQTVWYSSVPLKMVSGSEEKASFPVTRSMQAVSPASMGSTMLNTATAPGMSLASAMGFSRPSGW
ncbi:hypothetical protein EYF80_056718 [Liparis tanakae]|uniref:Uncharacterized protein n=1 Tax=Liparis tanakae TaxID=230148 RepID=A0A4Z2EWC9_9TELE|nr:hypothetical protein EYF80_056718 [Liparis tanakae]